MPLQTLDFTQAWHCPAAGQVAISDKPRELSMLYNECEKVKVKYKLVSPCMLNIPLAYAVVRAPPETSRVVESI